MSLDFTNASTDKIEFDGGGSTLDTLSTWTHICWLYPTALTGAASIFEKTTDPTGKRTVALHWNGNGGLHGQVLRNSGTDASDSSNGTVSVNGWNFIAATYDSAGSGNRMKFYHGYLSTIVTETSYAWNANTGSGAVLSDASGPFVVGNTLDVIAFPGYIGFVGHWNRTMSLEDIIAQQFSPHVTSGCVLFSHLGYPGTGIHPDLSGKGNAGTVSGATVIDHVPLRPPFGFNRILPYEVTGGSVYGRAVTDGVKYGDTTLNVASLITAMVDGIKAGDILANIATLLSSRTDGVYHGDTTINIAALSAAIADGVTAGDIPANLAVLLSSLTDGVYHGDMSSGNLTRLGAVSDGVSFGDTLINIITKEVGVTDGITLGDSMTNIAILLSTITDGVALTDTLVTAMVMAASLIDGVSISDTVAAGIVFEVSLAEGVDFGEIISLALTRQGAVTDGVELGDTTAVLATLVAAVVDAVSMGDTAGLAGSIYNAVVADGVTLGELASGALAGSVITGMKVTFTTKGAAVSFTLKSPTTKFTLKSPATEFTLKT